jgi:hypothetical protein
VLAAGLVLAHAALLVGVLVTSPGLAFVGALVAWVFDVVLQSRLDDRLPRLLELAAAGPAWRTFVRQLLIVVLVVRDGGLSGPAFAALVALALAHHLVYSVFSALRAVVRARRLRRLETRNMAVSGADLPPAPPDWSFVSGSSILLRTDLVLIAAVALAWAGHGYGSLPWAALVMVLAAVPVAAVLVPQVIALRRLPDDERRYVEARRAAVDLAPRVILYFSGGAADVYQVNMWLETMERLDRPALVLLRERRYLDDLGKTTLPVLCLPFTADLMNLAMPSARVALYVANVGRNIHLLREPGLKSAFIGHGDSDKTASFNPATKVYDEVWVAGEAGRDRYRRAAVGVRDEDIVLVGRPQLDAIADVAARPVGDPFTVLYAPTWEGWTDDPFQTSVTSMGLQIVTELLATPGVRVIYKPHPLTGRVNASTGAASEQIVAAIEAAGAPHEVILSGRPLYEVFDESDAMVSDISSVVSDYLRSGKPYFVADPAGLPADEFRARNPSAGAAYLIGPGAAGLREGMAAARGVDPLKASRLDVRTYLIGDPSQDSMSLFRKAVDELARKAEAQYGTQGLRSSEVDSESEEFAGA